MQQEADSPDKNTRSDNVATTEKHKALPTIIAIIMAVITSIVLVLTVFQVYEVDGQSMEDTLHHSDRLIIWKAPKTWASITNGAYTPKRYDIIVFKHSLAIEGSSTKRQLIKRVIGLPGDRVVVSSGKVKVFNVENPRGFLVDEHGPHASVISSTTGNVDLTVGENELFVLGDNRDNSSDSRSLGTIPLSSIVGKAELRIYPINKTKNL